MADQALPTLQCFKPGRHTPRVGAPIEFSESDLSATAGAYDASLHAAPLVVGHPALDAPAYGLVQSLAFAGGALEASPADVLPEFAELVNAGRYSKMSAAFWAPSAQGNPVPGVYYLRHIGFLGAHAPALKGLRRPVFAGSDEGILEFSEWDDVHNAGLWRSLRDWVLGKFGQDEADKAVPPYLVGSVERGAEQELRDAEAAAATATATAYPRGPGFAEKETSVTETERDAIVAENARLKAQIDAAAAAARAARLAAAHTFSREFAERLVSEAKWPQKHAALAVSVFDAFAEQAEAEGAELQFGEGEAKVPISQALRDALADLPPRVEFGAVATADRAAGAAQLDPNNTESIVSAAREHQRAESAAGRDVGIAAAVSHVMRASGSAT